MNHDPTKEGRWRGYTEDTSEEEARQMFEKRYGHPPEKVLRRPGIVLAGPVPEEDWRAEAKIVTESAEAKRISRIKRELSGESRPPNDIIAKRLLGGESIYGVARDAGITPIRVKQIFGGWVLRGLRERRIRLVEVPDVDEE